MAILYLIEQHTILRKSGERMLLCKRPPVNRYSAGVRESDIVVEWPAADISHVMIFGNVQVTTPAAHFLLRQGIELAYLSVSGKLLGQLTPPCGKNIFLKLKQFEKYHDRGFRLNFAKKVVTGKIANGIVFLEKYGKNHRARMDDTIISDLKQSLEKIEACQSADSLVGLEGAASARYFKQLANLLPERWRFQRRSKRPPKDPANAALSFGYTLVVNELTSLLDGVGFDPSLGYFHELDYGRPSLALDLLELFRHPLVDHLMLRLFNLSILTEEDFAPVAEGGIYLSKSGKKKFFIQYEKMMGMYSGTVSVRGEKTGYRRIFQKQVRMLRNAILNDVPLKFYQTLKKA